MSLEDGSAGAANASARQRFRNSITGIIMHGAGMSMAVRIAGLGLSYVANILLSRTLGISAFGDYVIALSWALVLTLPAKAGFDNSALRYSTIYLEKEDLAALRGFVRFGTAAVILVSLLMAALILITGATLIPVDERTRQWTALLILPLALLAFGSAVMRTARRIVSAQFYEQILRPALIIAGIAAAAVGGIRLSSGSAMGLTFFAALCALLGLVAQLRRALRPSRAHLPIYDDWQQWLAVSVPMLALSVVQELMNQVDIILLGQLADERQAALFAASWRLASLVPFALVGLATMAGPLIAAAYERGATDELHRVSSVVARSGFAFALVSAAILYLLGKPLLGLFGPEFIAGNRVLSVLLLGGIVNAFTGVVAYYATLTGRERQALAIFAGALVLSISLNLLLIPRFGAIGAAAASSSATGAWNFVMLGYVRRTLGIDASALALRPKFTLIKR
jgi:O-antigen/teichoic acid export membrane protein